MRSFALVFVLAFAACSSDPSPPTGEISYRQGFTDLGVLFCDNELACGRATVETYSGCVDAFVLGACGDVPDCDALIAGDDLPRLVTYYDCFLGWRQYTCGEEPACGI